MLNECECTGIDGDGGGEAYPLAGKRLLVVGLCSFVGEADNGDGELATDADCALASLYTCSISSRASPIILCKARKTAKVIVTVRGKVAKPYITDQIGLLDVQIVNLEVPAKLSRIRVSASALKSHQFPAISSCFAPEF